MRVIKPNWNVVEVVFALGSEILNPKTAKSKKIFCCVCNGLATKENQDEI